MSANFEFKINNSNNKDHYCQEFNTVEEAIEFYKRYPKQTELIKKGLSEKYDLQSFEIHQWFEDDYYGDIGDKITMNVKLNGLNLFLECGLTQDIDSFIVSEVKPFFLDKIEGGVSREYHSWCIDGVNLDKFLKRAKKIRLEIIE